VLCGFSLICISIFHWSSRQHYAGSLFCVCCVCVCVRACVCVCEEYGASLYPSQGIMMFSTGHFPSCFCAMCVYVYMCECLFPKNCIQLLLLLTCFIIHLFFIMTGRRGRRRKQLLDDLKETRGYWKLEQEALRRSTWRTSFERGCGPVVRQTTERLNS
jgi:hypothetical protein